jgi:hypothetical protein
MSDVPENSTVDIDSIVEEIADKIFNTPSVISNDLADKILGDTEPNQLELSLEKDK